MAYLKGTKVLSGYHINTTYLILLLFYIMELIILKLKKKTVIEARIYRHVFFVDPGKFALLNPFQ